MLPSVRASVPPTSTPVSASRTQDNLAATKAPGVYGYFYFMPHTCEGLGKVVRGEGVEPRLELVVGEFLPIRLKGKSPVLPENR